MLSSTPQPHPIHPDATLQAAPINNFDITGIEADDEDDTSDDDQGVFLGDHLPDELNLIAKLSESTSSTPSPMITRVKKRDSREFMRRKTLLLSSAIKTTPIARSVLTERQIPEREDEDSDSSSSSSSLKYTKCSCSTPMKFQDASDLTLDFAAFNLSSPRSSNIPTTQVVEDVGSDKENVPTRPMEDCTRDIIIQEDIVTIGQASSSEGSDEEIAQLDMGGLRLSDLSDPETGFENSEALEPKQSDDEETPLSPVIDLLPDGDTSSNLDSPLPVARAGPVVIPALSSHHFTSIRAETGSPCRTLPPPSIIPSPEPIDDSLELPKASSPIELKRYTASTPSRLTPLPPPDLVQRGAKLLKASITSKPSTLTSIPGKTAARTLTIRSQLDNALSSRMSALGPPQRSVSASSAGSSSSTASKLSSSTSSSSSRLTSAPAPRPMMRKPVLTASKPVMVSKAPAPIHKKHTIVPLASSTTKTLPRPALAAKRTLPALTKPALKPTVIIKPTTTSIPFKRPAPVSPPTARPKITSTLASSASSLPNPRFPTVVPTRPTLGQPSRNVHLVHHQVGPLQSVPVFSVGMAGDANTMSRPSFRSPSKAGMLKRVFSDKATPRKLGTPVRFGTPKQVTMTPSTFSTGPVYDVSAIPESVSDGPPATATRQASAEVATTSSSSASSSSPEPPRGSSADHEEVSVQLAKPPSPVKSPSPKKKKRPVGRPRKIPEPQTSSTVQPIPTKSKPTKPIIIVPQMSEKELKTTTHRNTIRNQVYHCAIDRQIIRQSGPRPPSPTSKIRTTAERTEEEKKQARQDRLKRRKGQSQGGEEEEKIENKKPVIEKSILKKFAGDESDYETPKIERPLKKLKKDNEDYEKDRNVKFDKGLIIIRDDGSIKSPSTEEDKEKFEREKKKKGCLRAKVELDHHGNLHEASRPIENLKRQRVVVNAVFYDGEEPAPFSYSPSNGTRSKKK